MQTPKKTNLVSIPTPSHEFNTKSLFSKFVAALGGQVGLLIFGFISQIIIARALGVEGKGTFSLIILVISLVYQFAHGSLGSANCHFTGRYPRDEPGLLGNSLLLSLVVGLLLIIGVSLYGEGVIARLYSDIDFALVRMVLLVLPGFLLFEFCINIVRGQNRITTFSVLLNLKDLLFLAFIIIIVATSTLSVRSALKSWVLAISLAAFFAFISAWVGTKGKISLSIDTWIRTARYAVKAHTANLSSFLQLRLDMLMLGAFLDTKTVGFYSVTFAIIQFLSFVPRAVAQILSPHISRSTDDAGNILTPVLCRLTLFVSTILGAMIVLLGHFGIRIIYGSEFLPAYVPLIIMVPGAILHTLATSLAGDLQGRGKPEYAMKISLLMLVINISVNYLLIPIFGMIGAALAASLTYGIAGLLYLRVFLKESGVRLGEVILIRRGDLNMMIQTAKRFF